jgi:hypothetical protein
MIFYTVRLQLQIELYFVHPSFNSTSPQTPPPKWEGL